MIIGKARGSGARGGLTLTARGGLRQPYPGPDDRAGAGRRKPMADFTPYQQKVIKRYYDNQDTIQRQKLAELVSELYLSTGKKRERAWVAAVAAMQKLGVPPSRIDHLRKQDKPELLAEVVTELGGT